MERLLPIGKAAEFLGVTIQTLRNWERKKILVPTELTDGGNRRYDIEMLRTIKNNDDCKKNFEDELKSIANRMKYILGEFKLNTFTMLDKMQNDNINYETQDVYDYLAAKRVPTLDFLRKFADYFFINKQWLLDGSSRPFNRPFTKNNLGNYENFDIATGGNILNNYENFKVKNKITKTYMIIEKDRLKSSELAYILFIVENDKGNFQLMSNSFYLAENFGTTGGCNLEKIYKIKREISFYKADRETWDLINSEQCYIKNLVTGLEQSYELYDLFDLDMPVDAYPEMIQSARKILEHLQKKE